MENTVYRLRLHAVMLLLHGQASVLFIELLEISTHVIFSCLFSVTVISAVEKHYLDMSNLKLSCQFVRF
jgi:hypothetical protein